MRIILGISAFQLSFCPAFGLFDFIDESLKIRPFSLIFVIIRTERLKVALHSVMIVGAVEIDEMQDQPNLETGVRPRNADPLCLAQSHRFSMLRMRVAIEHCPNFIVFRK